MPEITLLKPAGLSASPAFSHVAMAPGMPIYLAGQASVDASGALVGPGDVRAQLRQTFANIGIALEAAGSDFDHVLKLTTYMTRREDIPAYFDERLGLFAELFSTPNYPANSLFLIDGLVDPEMRIEIDVVAAPKA